MTIILFVSLERATFESDVNRAAGVAKEVNVIRVEFFFLAFKEGLR